MSEFETVARPYSKALYELATEQNKLQFWSDVLQLGASIANDEGVKVMAASPAVLTSQLAELFIGVMGDTAGGPEMTPEVKNLILLLAENERLLALPDIYQGYETYKQAAQGSIEVQVTSARKLTANQEKQMAESMKQKLGKEVTIVSEIDQSLIAGAIIHAGDLVIDGSARGRLNKMKSLLNK